ncbi:MAG TPA: M56 family metallopeptidase, partial [Phycisphaerae bacterium]|nr:M56 family metallopeptidase [Phycisphaerae bacterium]
MMNLLREIQGSGTVCRLGWTLLHTLWIGAAMAGLLAAALAVLRRRSAHARYLAACAALALLALSPVATFMAVPAPVRPAAAELPDPVVAKFPEAPAPAMPLPVLGHAAPATVPLAPAPAEAVTPARPPLLARVSAALEPAMPWLVLAWAAGVCVLSVWQLGGWIAAGRLKRLATTPPRPDLARTVSRLARAVGVSRPVRVLESVLVKVPGAIGWLKPVILLPAGLATGLTPRQLEAILTHELIHIRRCDYLVNLLQSLVETLLFYHPAVWFISGRIRAERENCCDDMVVAAGAERVCYAESLLHVAQRSVSGGRPAAAVAATGRPSQLRTRIARLLGIGDETSLRAVRSWPVALVLVAAIVVAGSVWISARGEPAGPSADKPLGPAAVEIAGRLAERLSQQRLPFLTQEKIDSLRDEMQAFLAGKCSKEVSTPTLRMVLASLDRYVPTYFPDEQSTYLDFPDRIATLKWKLWLALNRKPLDGAQKSALAEQAAWLRSHVGSIPEELPAYTRAERLRRLEGLFADPLMPLFKEPRPEAEFDQLKDKLRNLRAEVAVGFIIQNVVRHALWAQYPDPNRIGLPFEATVTGVGSSGDMRHDRVRLSFGANETWKGRQLSLGDIETSRTVLDVRAPAVVRAPDGIGGQAELERWAKQEGRGDIGYDDAKGGGLFAFRGAKMLSFQAPDWLAVDRMPTAELTRRVGEQGTRVVSLSGIPDPDYEKPGTYVAVLTAEGELSVIRIASPPAKSVSLHIRPRPESKEATTLPATAPAGVDTGRASVKTVAFRGKVVDADGQVVSGARVTALGVLDFGQRQVEFVRLGEEATAGKEGEFRIPAAVDAERFPMVILVARKAGRALGWIH